tara:strand:- start:4007 stop:12673 length:8667 start_codon:yes stop_codon:yes gene_type:complete
VADNLTLQIQQELARRGKSVSSDEISKVLDKYNFSQSPALTSNLPTQNINQPEQNMLSSVGESALPDWFESDTKQSSDTSLANALGVGLWSFTDSALFGLPGAFVEEEEYLDFEDPLAKWLGAVGGFAGFVGGAPMKIGLKASQKVASALAPKFVQKQGASTVIKGMREAGEAGGLSRKAINQTTSGYKRLVQEAQIDKTLQGEKFGEAVARYRDEYIELGIKNGIIKNKDEADAIRNMFLADDVAGGFNVFKRPIQDFQGLAMARWGDTKLARFAGHAANDVMVFSMIDAVFEGVSTIEDHEYDWTAPLWGVANGIAFSSLSFLNPRGKASSWFKDFKIGAKAAFTGKSPYTKLGERELASVSRYIGQSLKNNGEDATVKITYKGKTKDVRLDSMGDYVGAEFGSSRTLSEFQKKFGKDDAAGAMRSFLEGQRKKWGREIMKWATKEEAQNVFKVWPRMMLGGLLFNSQSFYQMYANDMDMDFANDILPHFLIGAYIQRRTNPSKFDLSDNKMIQIRENLALLGFKPDQLSQIPSLMQPENRFRNPLHDKINLDVIDTAISEGVISDDYVAVDTPLPDTELSVGLPQNKSRSFEQIYGWLRGMRAYQKPLDGISTESAKKIVDAFNKINPDVNLDNINSVEKMLDTQSLKMTEEFEQNFPNIISSVKNIEELGIIEEADGKVSKLKVPQHVTIDEEIIKLAREGKIDWLGLEGQEAVNALYRSVDGLNSIIYISEELAQVKTNEAPDKNTVILKELSSIKKIHERISFEESQMDRMFPDNSSMSSKFGFADNFNDYRFVVLRNHAIRTARGITDIFKPEFGERNELIRHLENSGLMSYEKGLASPLLVESVDQIRIKDSGDPEKDAERKRFLGRVLSIQSITGNYDRTNTNVTVDGSKIDILRNKLNELGYNESKMPMWMHKHIVDFAIRDKIEGTDLTIGDVDGIMALSGLGMASVGVDVTGKKTSGFTLKLIDEKILNEGSELVSGVSESDIVEYNSRVREIQKNSKGLVSLSADKVMVTDMEMLKIMSDSLKPNKGLPFGSDPNFGNSAKATLMEFVNILGESNIPGSAKLQDQIGRLLEEGGPESETRMLKWLNEFEVISLKENETKFEINLEQFNDIVALKMTKKINQYGVTPEYAERIYETLEKNSRDREMLDSGEGDYVKTITLQEFFDRYRIDGKKQTEPKKQEEVFNQLIFDDWEGRKVTKVESLDGIFDRLYVKNLAKTDWVKFSDLPKSRKNIMKPSMIADFIGLVGGRLNQAKVETVEWKNGRLTKGKEVKQTTRMDILFDGLDIKYMNIDPYITQYIYNDDGRRVQRRRINIFGKNNNLPEKQIKIIDKLRDEFNAEMGFAQQIDGEYLTGENGERGMAVMRLAPNLSPIAIKNADLPKIKAKFDEFADLYTSEESPLNQRQKNIIEDIQKSLKEADDNKRLASEVDYIAALRRLMLSDMLVGSDGDALFADFMNGKLNTEKLFGRTKLYDTKKFVTYDKEFILDVADSYRAIGDKETAEVLRNRLRRGEFGVVVWNDKNADVREEVNKYIKDNNIDIDLDNIIGDAHKDVSSFDSIAYISKDMMKYLHTMMGHSPDSTNPIKPVIASGGIDSPLLMGKTLFVYSKDLDGFFGKRENKNVDVILSASGAKAMNLIEGSMIDDAEWKDLNKYKTNTKQLRRISLQSIGVKPEKDVILPTGKRSHADMNYANNDESAKYFADEIERPLSESLRNAQQQIKDPISTRKWIRNQFGDDALVSMVDGTESLNHLNGMNFFAGLTRDANPMSYSENIVKNKIYGAYIDPLINNKRSVSNQFNHEDSERYGGQSSLIQAPIALSHPDARLRATLVDNDGVMKSRGEVMLPAFEADMKVAALISKGYELRIVEDSKVYTPEEIFKELKEDFGVNLDIDISLGNLHELVQTLGVENNRPNLQVGIIVRRNPRTRPNDLTLMGLKGFLDETYGNSMMVNSLDVVNVFEGDYDADKADYFFAERKNMYDHIQRTSQFWVQGVDPTALMKTSGFNWNQNTTMENDKVEEMSAALELYKSSIGLVQKVPRMLNYLGNLGQSVAVDSKTGKAVDISMEGEENSKILYEGPGYKIVMDYDNTDFYQRSALETQYIIDGKGDLNKEISNDIYSWRDDFLFPNWDNSKSSKDLREMNVSDKIGFTNQVAKKGEADNGQRVRIFRKLTKTDDGTFKEIDDLSPLDMSIVKEMLSEYGKLLQVTGDSVYEKSGEQKKTSYEDVMEASNRFFQFNQNLRKSLYYRLRNKYQNYAEDKDGNITNKDKWKDSNEFISLFGVEDRVSDDGKIKWKVTNNDKMFPNAVERQSRGFAEGKRGSPIERTLWKLWDANLFEETRVETLTGKAREYLNDWYDEFVFDNRMENKELDTSSRILKSNVLKTTWDINKKIDLIKSLNKKVMQIKYNKRMTWQKKQLAIDKINNLKEELHKELGKEWLGEKYLETWSSKDLQKIEFVDVNTSNMKKGTVYYSTMEQIKKFMPLINGDDSFGLGQKAWQEINDIKQYRKLFYGSQNNLGEIMKYGGRQSLSPEQQRFLERFPDMNTYQDIESALLLRGVNKHGLKFLWAFMQPSVNKHKIGVFNGNPIAVPFEAKEGYDPSSRYRRGLNFLTQLASRKEMRLFGEDVIDPEVQSLAQTALAYIQVTEAQFQRFFDRKFDMQKLVSDNLGDAFTFGATGQEKLIYDAIKLPTFHKDFEKRFGDFGTIQWTKTGDRIKNGFGLFNDHLFSFYKDIMEASGKSKEFDTYIDQMSNLQELMMSNNILNPVSYLHARNSMDADIRDIAQKTIGLGLKQGNLKPELTTKLMNNPVYALMGGSSYFKNLNLEKSGKQGMDSLKEMYKRSKSVENVKNNLPIDESSEERLRRMKDELIELEKCAV